VSAEKFCGRSGNGIFTMIFAAASAAGRELAGARFRAGAAEDVINFGITSKLPAGCTISATKFATRALINVDLGDTVTGVRHVRRIVAKSSGLAVFANESHREQASFPRSLREWNAC